MKKSLKDIESVMSLHGCGEKKVLLAKEETQTNLTQIAIIYLKAGEEGNPHMHWDIEEGFFVINGEIELLMGSTPIRMTVGDYVHVEMAAIHNLKAITDAEVLTIGCKI